MEAEFEEDMGRPEGRDYWLNIAVKQDIIERERADDKTP
jgi:hypothetical protein